jgi:ATP-binding cassette subfamily F protein 3
LLRALFNEHPLSGGELQLGASISAGFYRQDLSQVPLHTTIYDAIAQLRPTWERRLVQGHLGRFGFTGDEVLRLTESLSGGERARVALAILMLSRANLLVLDEPTNHLDVESVEALEDAIERYEGTVVLVSHDRELLRAVTTKVWALHGGRITEFDGGFAEWEVATAEREHAAAVEAQEAEALRRVHERQRVSVASRRDERIRDDRRRGLRQARRELMEAEALVSALEQKISIVTLALEDPELYTRPGGVTEARQLGAVLDTAKRELDAALERWSAAVEAAEAFERTEERR